MANKKIEEKQVAEETEKPQGRDTASEDSKVGPKPKAVKGKNAVVDLYTGKVEKTEEESAWEFRSQLKPYNPDDLVQKDTSYSIYEEMGLDDQVKCCLQIKRDLIVGSGFSIKSEEPDESHDDIIKDIRSALEDDVEVPFEDIVDEILSGDKYGFSLSEKIFKDRDDGSLTIKNVKTRHPATWLIHTDKQGNVTKYEQRGVTKNLVINPKSLIHYVNNRAFQNPYGQSDLRAAYNAWFTKRQVIKFYAIYLEKAASPTPVARYDAGIQKAAIDDIYNALKSFQAKTALVVPKTIEMDYLESKTAGEAYEKALNLLNMWIGRAMMIPDLLGFQGSETGGGSYSLGKDQIRVLFLHILRRRRTVEALINKHIVWPIVAYNHGLVENYPKFRFNPIRDEQMVEFVKLWLECVKGKTYKPSDEEINHFRRIIDFPEGDVEREEVVGVDPITGEPIKAGGAEGDEKGKGAGKGAPLPASKDGSGAAPEASEAKEKEKKSFTKLFAACPGDYDKKVDYTGLGTSMDRFKGRVLDEATPIVRRIYEDLYDQIRAKKILQTQDVSKAESLKVKFQSQLNSLLRAALKDGYREGKAIGHREIIKGAFRTPLPDEKFLEYLENETYQYVGDWAYSVTKKARVKILEAIRDGKPISAVIDLLDAEGLTDSMTSLERFARTKFTDVMNRGRMAAFNDSGVVSAYQYSAILDDRTTPICAGLHGKIFKNGTEPVPPMHFNCRSLLVPITKYEEFEVDDEVGGQSINEFIDENKGDGFAKR
jgi:SPP1 gp7 family putative phage head morphogenesis protein